MKVLKISDSCDISENSEKKKVKLLQLVRLLQVAPKKGRNIEFLPKTEICKEILLYDCAICNFELHGCQIFLGVSK